MMDSELGRLSEEQWQIARQRALHFQQHMLAIAREKGQGSEQVNFFPELFRLAADQIESDVIEFCNRAHMIFEEIDAFGLEPLLDDTWLDEVTGQKDIFYFSTDSLLTQLESLPGKNRGRQPHPPDKATVIEAVQQAVAHAEAQDALSVAHLENPSRWILKIQHALKENHGTADFALLRLKTGLSPGALFLGLLLGHDNWKLHQDTFYGQVTITSKTERAAKRPPRAAMP